MSENWLLSYFIKTLLMLFYLLFKKRMHESLISAITNNILNFSNYLFLVLFVFIVLFNCFIVMILQQLLCNFIFLVDLDGFVTALNDFYEII